MTGEGLRRAWGSSLPGESSWVWPTGPRLPNFDMPLREAREQFEKEYLQHKLHLAGGSVSKAAEAVGIERTHLYRKLKTLGILIKNQDPK